MVNSWRPEEWKEHEIEDCRPDLCFQNCQEIKCAAMTPDEAFEAGADVMLESLRVSREASHVQGGVIVFIPGDLEPK